jgi:serine/threonine-protein kinase
MLIGTARYASPEQARGRTLDGSSDVYSLALVLCEAVTGEVPYGRDTVEATLHARCEGDLEPPPELGPLGGPVAMAGRLDPAARPSAGELETALMEVAGELDPPAPLPLVGALSSSAAAEHLLARGRVDQGSSSGDATVVADRAGLDTTDVQPGLDDDGDAAVPAGGGAPEGEDEPAETGRRRRWGRWLLATVVILLLAGGAVAAWLLTRPHRAPVPDFVGRPVAEAMAAAKRHHWKLSTVHTRRTPSSPDEVLEQSVKPGTELTEGRRVQVTVSLGNEVTEVPPLTGRPEKDATAALQAAGLALGDVSRPNDEKVAAGTVMDAKVVLDAELGTPEEGKVPQGTRVDLTVSAGPLPREIPAGLVGQDLDAVKDALESKQLVVAVTEAWSDAVPAGQVTAVSKPPHAQVPRGSKIVVTVSKGPQPRPVPDVSKRSVAEATSILQRAGFPVAGVEGSPSTSVIATDPVAGSAQVPGTSVRLFTSR